MSASDLVAQLAACGTPPELLAAVAKELFVAETERAALESRRSNERARKHRERHGMSRDDTGQGVTSAEVTGQPPSLDKETSPRPPKEINPTPHTHRGGARPCEDFPRPDWADAQVWRDFLANRRKKNLTNSPTAYRKFLADIDRHTDDDWPPGRLLEAATARGWGAIYDGCKDELNGQGNHHHRQQPTSAWGAARDRVRLLPG